MTYFQAYCSRKARSNDRLLDRIILDEETVLQAVTRRQVFAQRLHAKPLGGMMN